MVGGRGFGQLGVQVGQIGMRLDAIGATRTDDGVQIRAGLRAQLRITKKPNAATERKWPDGVLNPVVVESHQLQPIPRKEVAGSL